MGIVYLFLVVVNKNIPKIKTTLDRKWLENKHKKRWNNL